METYDNETYILQTSVSVYGQFFPEGTEFKHVNADWWLPITSYGAAMPNYKVKYQVVRNNPSYFKLISG